TPSHHAVRPEPLEPSPRCSPPPPASGPNPHHSAGPAPASGLPGPKHPNSSSAPRAPAKTKPSARSTMLARCNPIRHHYVEVIAGGTLYSLRSNPSLLHNPCSLAPRFAPLRLSRGRKGKVNY